MKHFIFYILVLGSFIGFSQTTIDKLEADHNTRFFQLDSVSLFHHNRLYSCERNMYYISRPFHGALRMWQATGKRKYLDRMFKSINNMIADANALPSPVSSYYGWNNSCEWDPSIPQQKPGYDYGIALWESYTWRYVTTLLRYLYDSPNLRSSDPEIQSEYQNILNWTLHNMWDKWEALGSQNLYRSRTHMASHWARMGYDLWYITGGQKYYTVYRNIMYDGIPTELNNDHDHVYDYRIPDRGSILADNSTTPIGFMDHGNWDNASINDFSHYGDPFDFLVELYWQGELPNLSDGTTPEQVLEGFSDQWVQKGHVQWQPYQWNYLMNGTGSNNNGMHMVGYGLWAFQGDDIYNYLLGGYENNNGGEGVDEFHSVGTQEGQLYAVLSLAIKIRNDGCPAYPENWVFGSCGTNQPNIPPVTALTGTGKKKGIIIN